MERSGEVRPPGARTASMCQSGVVRQPLKGQVIAMNNTTYAVIWRKKVVQQCRAVEARSRQLWCDRGQCVLCSREPGLMVMEGVDRPITGVGAFEGWGISAAAEAAGWVGRTWLPVGREGRISGAVGASAAGNRCRRGSAARVHRAGLSTAGSGSPEHTIRPFTK